MKPITCQKCQKLLSLYIDSALDPEDDKRVESHIERCSSCAVEWQLLNRTVHLLHNMPKEKAPASLVHDIHLKLEKKSRLNWIKDWLSALPMKKASYGAVSLAFIGVVTAALIQNIPSQPSDSIQLAGKQKEKQQEDISSSRNDKAETTLLAGKEGIIQEEFYPDIPPLSEYKPGMKKPLPQDYRTEPSDSAGKSTVVDLVGTGNYYQKNRSDSFFPSPFPDIINKEKKPDLKIMFFPKNEKERNEQMYNLIHSSAWQARDRIDNTLLLVVPSENLDKLASLCSRYKGYSFQTLDDQTEQVSKYRMVTVYWH